MQRLLTVVTTVAILLVATAAFGTVFLYEDFETMPAGWQETGSHGLWHLETYRSVSGSQSAAYNWGGAAAPYPTYNTGSINWGTLYSAPVDVTGASAVYFDVNSWLHTENGPGWTSYGFDLARIGVYDTFLNPVFVFGPDINYFAHSVWMHISSPNFKPWLDSSAVSQFCLGFHFDTVDANLNDFEGWYLDDLRIHDGETPPIPEPSTWLLLSTGLLGVGAAARKRFFG
jgi:hypothetical protein